MSVPGELNGWDLAGVAGATALACGYGVGLARLWRRAGVGAGVPRWAAASAAAGIVALLAGLGPPLAPLADLRFAAHMGQHELLMLVAAPLLALGRPLLVLLWALPPRWRARVGDEVRRPAAVAAWRRITTPVAVLAQQAAVLWFWHARGPFEAALAHDGLHAVQHLTFFVSAALFWWALVYGRFGRLGYGAGVLVVFATAAHCGLLGALLTVARTPWYPTHAARDLAHGVDALADQQLAGLLMWVPAGLVLLVACLALFAAWLGEIGRRGERSTTAELLRDAVSAAPATESR
ncbi:MAG TPA: cytochrome c oxidase assembly protein [Thermoanaerobaculia bacterium]|nr:cytochrome c oxidase assembly protein [Thermoanaerobaculia bacterium]